MVGAAREKKGLSRLSLGLHSYHHQGYSVQLTDFIKAQAAARVGVAGTSLLRRRGSWTTNPAALKGAPASAALLCACSAVLIYLDLSWNTEILVACHANKIVCLSSGRSSMRAGLASDKR